jgi:hypothetical protein
MICIHCFPTARNWFFATLAAAKRSLLAKPLSLRIEKVIVGRSADD